LSSIWRCTEPSPQPLSRRERGLHHGLRLRLLLKHTGRRRMRLGE
jgi:hypothetical protein